MGANASPSGVKRSSPTKTEQSGVLVELVSCEYVCYAETIRGYRPRPEERGQTKKATSDKEAAFLRESLGAVAA